jgi:exodeoxyribonuclease VII small subunit
LPAPEPGPKIAAAKEATMAKSAAGKAEALPADIRKMSFEDALDALEEIVQKLESGEVLLEESIDIYSRGTQLKAHCEQKLQAAREKVDKIVSDGEGEVTAEPAEID